MVEQILGFKQILGLNKFGEKLQTPGRSLLEAGGVDRLMNVTRQRAKYTSR